MRAFLRMSYVERRGVIQNARNQGSISPELKLQLDHALSNGSIRLILGDTETAQCRGSKVLLYVTVKDKVRRLKLSADRVVLATGYRLNIRPGGQWIDVLERELRLPTHEQYPVLNDATLQWGATHQLYIAGQLAELSLGPLARNIAGTQLAAHKIKNAPAIRVTIRHHTTKATRSTKRPQKTILITGGSGYIGSVFVDHYARRCPNCQIIVVVRSKKPHIQFPRNVHTVEADYGNQRKMERLFYEHRVSQVLHLASGLSESDGVSNITKSESLFRAMRNADVNQLVYSSSLMVYQRPQSGSNGRLTEASLTRSPSACGYAASKRAIEEMIHKSKDWRSVILRYAIVIGASANHRFGDVRQKQGILSTYLHAARHAVPVCMPDDGNALRDFIDVQDIASATDKALEWIEAQDNPSTITLNVSSGQTHSINQLIEVVERVADTTIKVERSSRPPHTPVSFLDNSLIRETFGWEPCVTFQDSIKHAWQFLIESSD